MEWSQSNIGTAAKVGLAFSAIAIALTFALRDAGEQVQIAAGLALVVTAFVASTLATRGRQQAKPTGDHPSGRHQVSHIPLHSDARHAA